MWYLPVLCVGSPPPPPPQQNISKKRLPPLQICRKLYHSSTEGRVKHDHVLFRWLIANMDSKSMFYLPILCAGFSPKQKFPDYVLLEW